MVKEVVSQILIHSIEIKIAHRIDDRLPSTSLPGFGLSGHFLI